MLAPRTQASAAGFTLIELMVVVAIIGILASVAIPEFTVMKTTAREAERTVFMQAISSSLVEHWRTGAGGPQYTLPNGANCGTVPIVTGNDQHQSVMFLQGASTAQTACWNSLGMKFDQGTRCRWTYTSGTQAQPKTNSAYFELSSSCDNNGDGITSTVLLHCSPGEKMFCDNTGGASYWVYSGDIAEIPTQGTEAYGTHSLTRTHD